MVEVWIRMTISVIYAIALSFSSVKLLGVMQQCAYQSGTFLRWLKGKDNMTFNRLCVLTLCLALSTAVTALCFSFLGVPYALLLSAIPFFALWLWYAVSDRKKALKVSVQFTARLKRLVLFEIFFNACFSYAFISFLNVLSVLNGSMLYALVAYVPFALTAITRPFILALANAFTSIFENARNERFVKRAGQVLNARDYIRIGVVGSCGKTSVKNILATILSEKYAVLSTPASYNTPIGIAKTVMSEDAENAEVFIAEMGARKKGDIAFLCDMVKPNLAIFTGVCEQHIKTFGSIENVYAEKSKILDCPFVVCGESLQECVKENANAYVVSSTQVKDVQLLATETRFTLCFDDGKIPVTTKLLGSSAVQNVLLCATLAKKLGLTNEQIGRGISKIATIPHRLQLMENGGVYILDDGYNSNIVGVGEALSALSRFSGKKCVVSQGLVECGVLEEELNVKLGQMIAKENFDKVVLVGETLIGAVKSGYLASGGSQEKLVCVKDLEEAKSVYQDWLTAGDAILFLNDLPDVY